ncbi:MAG: NCS2 family permease [Halanaerobiaceae bacterium]
MNFLEKTFELEKNNTDIQTEFIAGITTFMTMAYIIFANPNILSKGANMPFEGVFIATILGAVLGTLCMAFLTNYPFALASGMGLNAFFAFAVVDGMGVSWQAALGIVFIEGIVFIILSVTPVRKMIVNAIPMSLKTGISAGIGLFIAFIGLQNAELIVSDSETLVTLGGNIFAGESLVALIGLLVAAILYGLKVKGALVIGILVATIFGLFNGVSELPSSVVQAPSFAAWDEVFLELEWTAVFRTGMIAVFISFLFVDMFDTAGTLVGISQQAGYLDDEGNLPRANRALLADAIGTTGGALFGTSTVTTYIESAAGVGEGGRTGLTGVFVSLFFLLALFFRPIVQMVPEPAITPALVVVGTLMMSNISELDWDDFTEVLPAFIAMIVMPFTYSISNGIALGFIFYPLVKVFTGKHEDVHWLVYLLGLAFVIFFLFAEIV